MVLAGVAQTAVAEDPIAAFVQATLGAPAPPSTLSVTGDVSRVFHATLGNTTPREVRYYPSATHGTVWVLSAPGRHGPIVAAFAVHAARIRECRIIEDREQRGRGIRSGRYLRQFTGLSLGDGGRFDRRVDGISGATVSSRAVEKMALLALQLDEETRGDGATPGSERQEEE